MSWEREDSVNAAPAAVHIIVEKLPLPPRIISALYNDSLKFTYSF